MKTFRTNVCSKHFFYQIRIYEVRILSLKYVYFKYIICFIYLRKRNNSNKT